MLKSFSVEHWGNRFGIQWRNVAVGLLVCFALMLIGLAIYRRFHFHDWASDFQVFWRTARSPLSHIYDFNPVSPFAYPPTAIIWLRPLGLMQFWPSFILYTALSVLVFVWAGRRSYSLSALLLSLLSPPFIWSLASGQLLPLIASAIFVAFRAPPWAKGTLLAVVMSIKPQLVFLAPLVLLRDRQALMWLAVSGLSIGALNLIVWGTQPWIDWIASVHQFGAVAGSDGIARKFISPSGWAHYYDFPVWPVFLLALAISSWAIWKQVIDDPAALLVGCSIFASPYALPYDLVVLMPWAATAILAGRLIPAIIAGFVYFEFLLPVAWAFRLIMANQKTVSRPRMMDRAE